MLARGKHSSLFYPVVCYKEKKVLQMRTRVNEITQECVQNFNALINCAKDTGKSNSELILKSWAEDACQGQTL
jgi:hypothetical protein